MILTAAREGCTWVSIGNFFTSYPVDKQIPKNNDSLLPAVGFRRSFRLSRRRSAHGSTLGPAQATCHSRCPSNCYNALNMPYEEVVRYQRQPQDAPRLLVLLGRRHWLLASKLLISIPHLELNCFLNYSMTEQRRPNLSFVNKNMLYIHFNICELNAQASIVNVIMKWKIYYFCDHTNSVEVVWIKL